MIWKIIGFIVVNLAALAALILALVALPHGAREVATLGVPQLCGLWVLIQGRRLVARWARWAIAGVASLLFALQVFVLAFLAWFDRGFGNIDRATGYIVFLAAALLVSGVSLWVYLHPASPDKGPA